VKARQGTQVQINSSELDGASPTLARSILMSVLDNRVVPQIWLARCVASPSVHLRARWSSTLADSGELDQRRA